MKRITTAAALFGAVLTVPAIAADMPVKAAPPAAVVYSWTGFYIGGHVGYAWGNTRATDSVATNGACWTICGRPWSTKHDGFVGGGQVGYNWQIGQAVLGVEADFGTLGGRHSAVYPVTPATTLDVRGGFYSTVRGRIGGLVWGDSLLLYGTAGWIGANLRPTVNQPVPTILHTGDTGFRSGYTVGGGAEYAFTRAWSFKGEVLFYAFPDKQIGGPIFGGTVIQFFKIKEEGVMARVGLNYRFGAPLF
jgi:outer membrane immunogenic protein